MATPKAKSELRVRKDGKLYLFEKKFGKIWTTGLRVLDKKIVDRMVKSLQDRGCKVSI